MLEAARVLTAKGHRTKATLKFIAFGAEETGLDGSYEYVDANEEEVTTKGLGMVNLDMIGVGDTLQIGNIDYGDPARAETNLRTIHNRRQPPWGCPGSRSRPAEQRSHLLRASRCAGCISDSGP